MPALNRGFASLTAQSHRHVGNRITLYDIRSCFSKSSPRGEVVIKISDIVDDFAIALAAADAKNPIGPAMRFKPGVGPLTETEVTDAILGELRSLNTTYGNCGARPYPQSRNTCDVVISGEWAIEIKLARPFGDNGRPAERWSENLLYPYAGNTSSIGDCLKLLESSFAERKGIIVIAYEHTPPRIAVEPALRGFELIASSVVGIQLSAREERLVKGLVHPVHQQARVLGWEVLGRIT